MAAIDAAMLILALLASYALRFNFAVPYNHVALLRFVIPFTLAVEALFLYALGCNRAVWRWFSSSDLPRLMAALALATGVSLLCRAAFGGISPVRRFYPPIGIALTNFVFSTCALAGTRWLWRIASEPARRATSSTPVAIYGTGSPSLSVAYSLRNVANTSREVIGFIGEDHASVGATIQGLPVLAALPQSVEGAAALPAPVAEIIVPQNALDRDGMQRMLALARATGARLTVAPAISDAASAAGDFGSLRDADITDVLKRGILPSDTFASHREFLEGRSVLVTGAGGSIGSEIARQALAAGVSRLALVERGELALFNISRELASSPRAGAITRHVADVSDAPRISRILAAERPDVVFHAAAYKHVPLMEENVCEAVRNNILGTATLARECVAAGVGTFVLLSSDKAVEPSSVMGATKRVCELAIMDIARNCPGTRFTAVRFGNVLGSTGSVVPVFREQILAGGPVTITHPDMERFFMTIPEASSLTLVAAAMAPAFPGCAFVLEMGSPVKITTLAEDMIRLAGKVPGRDVKLAFTGVRPGEKLREQLTAPGESPEPTGDGRISRFRISPPPPGAIDALLASLAAATAAGDDAAARASIMAFAKGGPP
ncbi:MAG: polysaccharide biosynthesis protein [Kiritimatiellae bacterium]|nr:polysaccharide biosynthesis protein [Kiritimatiellia bacterium]